LPPQTRRDSCESTADCLLIAVVALAGCASRPINEPIAQVDPQAGYRPIC